MREYAGVTDVSLICDKRSGAYTQTILKPDKDRQGDFAQASTVLYRSCCADNPFSCEVVPD